MSPVCDVGPCLELGLPWDSTAIFFCLHALFFHITHSKKAREEKRKNKLPVPEDMLALRSSQSAERSNLVCVCLGVGAVEWHGPVCGGRQSTLALLSCVPACLQTVAQLQLLLHQERKIFLKETK